MCVPQSAINSASNQSPALGGMLSTGKNIFTTFSAMRPTTGNSSMTVSRTTPAVFGGSRTKTMSVGTLG